MKRLILITCLSLCCLVVRAQQDTIKQKEEYALLSATTRFFNANKVDFEIFLGEKTSVSKYSDQEIKDQQKNIEKLHSIPDGLNYMAKQGWVLANAYVIVNSAITYHYIFRRHLLVAR